MSGRVSACWQSEIACDLRRFRRSDLGSWIEAKAEQRLRLGPTRTGARCYLCVQGGIAVELFLGSASTHILSGLGGHEGRALRKGDALMIGAEGGAIHERRLTARALKE